MTAPGVRLTAKAEQKRRSHDAILDTAERLLRERGIVGASVADVMHGAGLTVGGFYAHFASKTALVDAALRRALAAVRARLLAGPGDPRFADRAEAAAGDTTEAAARGITDAAVPGITDAAAGDITDATARSITDAAAGDITEATTRGITDATARGITDATARGITESIIERVIERYLSAAHRDDATAGCPLPAVVGEVATAAPAHRDALRDHLDTFAADLEPHLPVAGPPSLPPRQLALALLALLYGGLALARAVRGTELSDDILRACRALGRATTRAEPPSR